MKTVTVSQLLKLTTAYENAKFHYERQLEKQKLLETELLRQRRSTAEGFSKMEDARLSLIDLLVVPGQEKIGHDE